MSFNPFLTGSVSDDDLPRRFGLRRQEKFEEFIIYHHLFNPFQSELRGEHTALITEHTYNFHY